MKQISYIWFLLFCLLNSTAILRAQSTRVPYFENYRIEQGLPSNKCYQVLEDHRGLLWLATANGLCSYDGTQFHVFQEDSTQNSISDSHAKCLLFDRKGNLWIGTQLGGLNHLDIETNTFTSYRHDKNDPFSISNDEVLSLMEDQRGDIWVGTENGLNRLDPATGRFERIMPQPDRTDGLQAKAILSMMEDRKGRFWIGTWDGGLHVLENPEDTTARNFKVFYPDLEKPQSISGKHIWSLFEDKDGHIWVGTFFNGLNLLINDPLESDALNNARFMAFRTERNNDKSISSSMITGFSQDQYGRLWIGTVYGLNILELPRTKEEWKNWSPDKASFLRIFGGEVDPEFIAHDQVEKIYRTSDEIIWISTIGGLSKYDEYRYPFEHLMESPKGFQNHCRSFHQEGKVMWVATEGVGLVKYDLETNTFKRLLVESGDEVSDKRNYLRKIWNEGNYLWLGHRGGLSKIDKRTEQIQYFPIRPDPKQTFVINVSDVFPFSKDTLLLGTDHGLIFFDKNSSDYRRILPNPEQPNSLSHQDINAIKLDHNGDYWLATYGGLNKMQVLPDGSLYFTSFLYDKGDPNSICSNRILGLEIVGKELWIGTEDGLMVRDIDAGAFRQIGHKRLNSSIYAMIHDENGTFWGSTSDGLFSIDLESEKLQTYDIGLGLDSKSFAFNGRYIAEDGKVYFGTNNGFIAFYPDNIQSNQKPPNLIFTNFFVFDQPLALEKDINYVERIELDYQQNYFSIHFAALNFHQPEKNRYQYQLEGFDNNWRDLNNRNFVSYSNLNGGDYTFRVKAANNDGVWNEEGIALQIRIHPPLWKEPWFVILMVALLVFLLIWLYRQRIKSLEKSRIKLEKLVEERTREVKQQKQQIEGLLVELQIQNDELEEKVSQRTQDLQLANEELRQSNNELEQFAYAASHDMKEPLRMVGNFVQLLHRKYGDKLDDTGNRYVQFAVAGVQRMADLIESLLRYATYGRRDIAFTEVNLNEALEQIRHSIQAFIKEKNARLIINPLPEHIHCEPNQLSMVFQNLILNGFKFNESEQPTVEVSLHEENPDFYCFKVSDNGIGVPKESQEKIFTIFKRLNHREQYDGTGIGLAICHRIIIRHRGSIWLESEPHQGTTFYFTIKKDLVAN